MTQTDRGQRTQTDSETDDERDTSETEEEEAEAEAEVENQNDKLNQAIASLFGRGRMSRGARGRGRGGRSGLSRGSNIPNRSTQPTTSSTNGLRAQSSRSRGRPRSEIIANRNEERNIRQRRIADNVQVPRIAIESMWQRTGLFRSHCRILHIFNLSFLDILSFIFRFLIFYFISFLFLASQSSILLPCFTLFFPFHIFTYSHIHIFTYSHIHIFTYSHFPAFFLKRFF